MGKISLTIRIGHQKILDHLLLGVAPFFEKTSPLQFTSLFPVESASWDTLCDSLLEREIHGAFLPIPMAIDLFDAGIDICLLMFPHKSGSLFLRSRSVTSLDALHNSSVLLSSEYSVDNMLIHRFLASAGLDFEKFQPSDLSAPVHQPDVTREIVPYSIMDQMISMDAQQDIAGCMICHPFASRCLAHGKTKTLCVSDELWQDHPCCGFVLYKDILEKHPEAVEEILSLFCEAAYQLERLRHYDGITECAQVVAEFLNQESYQVQKLFSSSRISFSPEGLMPEQESLDIIVSYMSQEMNVLAKTTNIDGFIVPGPLQRVLEKMSSSGTIRKKMI